MGRNQGIKSETIQIIDVWLTKGITTDTVYVKNNMRVY